MTDAIIPRSPGTVTLWLLICVLGTFLVSIPSALAALSEDHDAARAVFAEAVAAEFGVGSHEVIVQPRYAGLPDNPYDALAAGPYLAFEATLPALDLMLRGFATPDGRAILGRNTGDMADFLSFAGLSERPVQAEDLARRLMWIFETETGTQLISGHPRIAAVVPPAVKVLPDGGIEISWFVTTPGNTGYIDTYRCLFELNAAGSESTYLRVVPG